MKKGAIFTEEHRRKLSLAKLGKKLSPEHRAKIAKSNTGKKRGGWTLPPVTRAKYSERMKRRWRILPRVSLSKTPLVKRIRKTPEYKEWRRSIFERDDFICSFCGRRGGILNVDHIVPFSRIIDDLRRKIVFGSIFLAAMEHIPLWSQENGRTICVSCHKLTPTYGRH